MPNKGFDARDRHPHPSDDRPFSHPDIPEEDVIHLGPSEENEEDRRFRRPDEDLDAFLEDWEDVPEVDLPRRRPATPPIRPRRIEVEEENQDRWSKEALRGTPEPNRARQRQQRRRREPQVPFPASLFGLPYEEYAEKPEWYDNLSWGILGSYMIAILSLLIAIL